MYCEIINVCYKCVTKIALMCYQKERSEILNDLNDLDLNDRLSR